MGGGASKPSVIVVQRSHGGSAKALVTKDGGVAGVPSSGGSVPQRLIHTKTKQQPIVIVSKPSASVVSSGNLEHVSTAPTTASAATAVSVQQPPTSTNQVKWGEGQGDRGTRGQRDRKTRGQRDKITE